MAKRTSKNKKRTKAIVSAVVIVLAFVLSLALDKAGVWDKAIDSAGGFGEITASESDVRSKIYFLDVGQGDSTLFVSGTHSMLIDSGEKEYADTVIEKLRELKIEKPEYVVVTHAHSDHMGGMAKIINTFGAENIIISEPSDKSAGTSKYEKFLNALELAEADGAKLIKAKPGYTFSVGEFSCEILAPFNVSLSEENNNSVVIRAVYGESTVLMTGDAEKELEKEIAVSYPNLKADILKVPHHGSNTSSTDLFLGLIKPETAVICVGNDNSYNHPNAQVVEKIAGMGANVYQTNMNGTVTVSFDGGGYTVETQR